MSRKRSWASRASSASLVEVAASGFHGRTCSGPALRMTPAPSVELAIGGRGQEGRIENIARFRLGPEPVGQRDLIYRLGEPRPVDRAEAIGAHLRGDDIVPDRHPQPF